MSPFCVTNMALWRGRAPRFDQEKFTIVATINFVFAAAAQMMEPCPL
jgi:hypothetical protein